MHNVIFLQFFFLRLNFAKFVFVSPTRAKLCLFMLRKRSTWRALCLRLGLWHYFADRGSSTPPAFKYTSEDFRDEQLQNWNAEECEFSVTSEWQCILAAANAAGMSSRDSSGNNSEFETSCEVSNVSDLDLDSAVGNCFARPHIVRKPRRTLSMDLPRLARTHHRSASGDYGNNLVDDNKYTALSDSKNLGPRQPLTDIICGKPLSISRGSACFVTSFLFS